MVRDLIRLSNSGWDDDDELETLQKLADKYGNRWSMIAKELGTGRTPNAIHKLNTGRRRSSIQQPPSWRPQQEQVALSSETLEQLKSGIAEMKLWQTKKCVLVARSVQSDSASLHSQTLKPSFLRPPHTNVVCVVR